VEEMNLKIDTELKDLIPPLAEDELKQLEGNLLKEGWRDNERIITWNNTIVDGHNRYSVCTKHNIPFKIQEKQFKDKNEVILWMIDNQLGRRNMPDYARVELNLRKEDILRPIAREKQINPFRDISIGNEGVSHNCEPVKVIKKIAQISSVSHNTVARVKFIRDNADEETKSKLRSGNKELSINKVYTDLKKKEQRENVLKECKEAPKLEGIKRKYKIIYADPAWKYFAGGNKNQSQHYAGMSIEEIKALKVSELADDDCILFLWVTFPILPDAFEVIKSWGFKYSTCGFNWVKKNKSGEGWFFGLGNWTRSNSELCLIATKGSPLRFSASVSQVIDTPIQEHSKKPDCVRDKIVELCGDLPRIELFTRQKVKGWDFWGNEVK
jgi:N6-adenosine-specific RNA methylase IME4